MLQSYFDKDIYIIEMEYTGLITFLTVYVTSIVFIMVIDNIYIYIYIYIYNIYI